jgi:hypothetical protein
LNETSSYIWQNCDGKKGIADLSFALQKKAKQPVKKEVIWLALNDLKKEGLVSFEAETPQELTGLNRREVIRKIGFASMVTLPIITSLVAPTAAMAQSGIGAPIGGACQNINDCREVDTAGGQAVNCNNSPKCPGAGKCCFCREDNLPCTNV